MLPVSDAASEANEHEIKQ